MVVLTGLSGAGKTTAMQALEDIGFFVSDNVPPGLWLALIDQLDGAGVERLAVGLDIRCGSAFLRTAPEGLSALRAAGTSSRVVFLDASESTLIRRFNFTRRTHPLSDAGLTEDIAAERAALEPLRSLADHVIDTTLLTPTELKQRLWSMFAAEATFTLRLVSFGYKRGAPSDTDLVLDVRGMPNPYYDTGLRALAGTEAAVQAYVFAQSGLELYGNLRRLAVSSAAAARDGGRSSYAIGVGCTGGQHRSVAVVERLQHDLAERFQVNVRHRDLDDALREHHDAS